MIKQIIEWLNRENPEIEDQERLENELAAIEPLI